MVTRSWRALGTSVHLIVTEPSDADLCSSVVSSVLDQIDLCFSRFRPDSELSRLNDRPNETICVSPLLSKAIGVALRSARRTDGAVDPTVGAAMRLIGYDDDFARIHDRTTSLKLRLEPVPGWQAVRYEPTSRTVFLPRGVELDLGSTGKALAADLAAEAAVMAAGRGGVLVSLGGDIATRGASPPEGWQVLAAEDSDTPVDSEGEVVALHEGAIATSSTTVRRWTRGGVELHHLIDPSTGLPADGPWRTATVIADTCVDANTAATAAIVRGASATDGLRELGLPARLVSVGGHVLRLGGWPQPVGALA